VLQDNAKVLGISVNKYGFTALRKFGIRFGAGYEA
jgi:hypothetical protein